MPSDSGNSSGVLKIGDWLVNPALDTIARGAETHKLEPRTMRLLLCLVHCAGEVVSVDRLLTEVWTGVVVGSASVYQAVSQLRKILGDSETEPSYIATIPRKGYRLIAPVARTDPATPVPRAAEAVRVGLGAGAGAGAGVASEPPQVVPTRTDLSPASPAAVPSTSQTVRAEALTTSAITVPGTIRFLPLAVAALLVVAVIAAAALIWRRAGLPHEPANALASIVVLPFIDMTAEKADQSFCDGLTEELSNWLSQIPTLRVVARTSAFAFRGKADDVRKIGKDLNTNHVLEGSLRRFGDHVRVTVQLIDARNGYHLWSTTFDRALQDTIQMQEDISRSVAQTLKLRLTAESERQFSARHTSDVQAYQLYLQGRYFQQQLTSESTRRAIDLYRQVLIADPNFSPAYVQLAYALLNQGYYEDRPIQDVAAQMEPLIQSALQIDPQMAAAYAVRGALRATQSRNAVALEDLQRAVTLDPNNLSAFSEIGRLWLVDGQPRKALVSYDRAASLDPLNFNLQNQRCTALEDLARYAEAEGACEHARVLQPRSATVDDVLAWLAESQGHIDEALRWNADSLRLEPTGDFDLYWSRATFFLSVGLSARARQAIASGLAATHDEVGARAALVRVVYQEGGQRALREYVDSVHIDQSPHAVELFEASYARLLLGQAQAAKDILARALTAPDRSSGFAESAWYARGMRAVGTSYRIDLAAADMALGDAKSAGHELTQVRKMLDGMIASGVKRNGTYELFAKVDALAGQPDAAMRELNKAAELGWRRAWWAMHEPYFASLRSRQDFQALMGRIDQSNKQLLEKLTSVD